MAPSGKEDGPDDLCPVAVHSGNLHRKHKQIVLFNAAEGWTVNKGMGVLSSGKDQQILGTVSTQIALSIANDLLFGHAGPDIFHNLLKGCNRQVGSLLNQLQFIGGFGRLSHYKSLGNVHNLRPGFVKRVRKELGILPQ